MSILQMGLPSEPERSEALDALRGLAISLMIAPHYFGFKYGMLGVDLFLCPDGDSTRGCGLSHEFLLPGRLDELFGGVLLACYARGYCRSPVAWLLLVCAPPLCDLIYAGAS